MINKLNNKVEQDFWLKELSQKAKVDEVFLREELNNVRKTSETGRNLSSKTMIKNDIITNEDTWEDKLMENILSLMLKFSNCCEYVFNNLSSDYLSGKYQEFYNLFLIYYNKNKEIK